MFKIRLKARTCILRKFVVQSLGATLVSVAFSTQSLAATIIDQNTGLFSPGILTLDFGASLFAPGTLITDQFSAFGVNFGSTYNYTTIGIDKPALALGSLVNENLNNGVRRQPGSILFQNEVNAAAFSWLTNTAVTTFSAYLDGSLVETFDAYTTLSNSTGRYYGFQDIAFNEIRMSIAATNTAFTLDNLQFGSITAVPVPAAFWLFASGLISLIGVARHRTIESACLTCSTTGASE